MNIDPVAILALLSEQTNRIVELEAECIELRRAVDSKDGDHGVGGGANAA